MKNIQSLFFSIATIAGVVNGSNWSSWLPWSSCSTTCLKGYQYRTRFCIGDAPGSLACPGSWWNFRDCYSSYSCTTDPPTTTPPPTTTTTTTTTDGNCFNPSERDSYRGSVSKTKSGYTCQSWQSQDPHKHYFIATIYPNADLGNHNYCRNPDSDELPWCFTTNKMIQWEHCTVPICSTIETTTKYTPEVTSTASTAQCGRPDISMSSAKTKARRDEPIHIVGGVEATPGSMPWQVSLRRTYSGMHFCGASVLNNDWILTAAHCVTDPGNPSSYFGILGDHRQYTTEDTEKRVEFANIFRHERYSSITLVNDITLLKMTTPVTYTRYIKPICLPPIESIPANNLMVTVSGWGTTQGTGSNAVLRQTSVPVIENSRCRNLISGVFSGMICAGFVDGGKDSCQGDSGGPLVRKTMEGRYELVGIVSWGYGCAVRNKPGVYTRVSHYINWINGIVNTN